ncbi:MAG: hypothetical protein ACTHLB_16380 [Parafilimonas sp.]
MFFGILIVLRVLFIAAMVFIIGYVFGNFSARPVLKTITKVAAILVIVLFLVSNAFFFRFRAWNHNNNTGSYCAWQHADSTRIK